MRKGKETKREKERGRTVSCRMKVSIHKLVLIPSLVRWRFLILIKSCNLLLGFFRSMVSDFDFRSDLVGLYLNN